MEFAAITARPSSLLQTPDRLPGSPVINAEWQHYALLVYAVPVRRAWPLLPAGFEPDEFSLNGQPCALISVESFLDNGSGYRFGHCAPFEQTSYRLHVRRRGLAGTWLLSTAVGSLTAVAPRHLWPLPWHLSAMEFQVTWDQFAGCYHEYRLQTSSQQANAFWSIQDTGQSLAFDPAAVLPALPFRATTDWFRRADGACGEYRITRSDLHLTRAHLKHSRCELLERTGLVTSEELMRPHLVALQRRLTAQIHAPAAEKSAAPYLSRTMPAPGSFAAAA
ncbi:MAG TPA: DUF2071 domain-containing protein [Blastocatellia bacterium]|nr:DUF2071 domain-containing protein [Blastocatellia bacterium]